MDEDDKDKKEEKDSAESESLADALRAYMSQDPVQVWIDKAITEAEINKPSVAHALLEMGVRDIQWQMSKN